MYGTEHSKGYMEKAHRLQSRAQQALESGNFDGFIKDRFALLGYSYSEDDSGSGSALSSIIAASASLGSAYIMSQNQPQVVAVPTNTRPVYGAAAPGMHSSTILWVGLAFVAVLVFMFSSR